MSLGDVGYTKYKLNMLKKSYLHEPSWEMAQKLWERLLSRRKYGSVGFHCYNHLIKGRADDNLTLEKKSPMASVMGPCIQGVVLTLLRKDQYQVDIHYRTTELLKKFPADLVFLRDILLKPFEGDCQSINFYFSNLSLAGPYWIAILPMMKKPVASIKNITDPRFKKEVAKWTGNYLLPEKDYVTARFAQLRRVKTTAENLLEEDARRRLIKYLRKELNLRE